MVQSIHAYLQICPTQRNWYRTGIGTGRILHNKWGTCLFRGKIGTQKIVQSFIHVYQ